MEAEVAQLTGAQRGERSSDRVTHLNGYRPRLWETRVGELELAIPRTRSGPAYFPAVLEPRRRCEQAIVAVVMEAYVNGVSTRKVDRLVEQLGIQGMDKDRVSRLCRELDEHVEQFRSRPLDGAYRYLWLDAKDVRVRDRGRVLTKALVIAYGVHDTGRREVIGLDLGEVESEAFWIEFLRGLRSRGLSGLRLVVSDHHEGLKTAIARILAAPWQRCCVHFVRNMHGHCRPSQRGMVSAALREVFNAPDEAEARRRVTALIDRLADRSRRSASCSRRPRTTCWPSWPFPPRTGRSCDQPIRSSASTARSPAAPTSSGSSPTTPPPSASPARSSSSRTMSGWSRAATSPKSRGVSS